MAVGCTGNGLAVGFTFPAMSRHVGGSIREANNQQKWSDQTMNTNAIVPVTAHIEKWVNVSKENLVNWIATGGKVPASFSKANAKLVRECRVGARSLLTEQSGTVTGNLADKGFKVGKVGGIKTLKDGSMQIPVTFYKPAPKAEPAPAPADAAVAAELAAVKAELAALKAAKGA